MNRVLLTSVLGGIIEWAEYTFYAYLAVLFAQLFFPAHNPHTALLSAFAVFGVGYLMRPVGAMVFSHIGDTYGRRTALAASMMLMGGATLAIGLLPTYAELGLWASALLLLCRLVQGFAVAGELNGAAIFLIEHDQYRQPFFMGSWSATAAATGTVLGGLAAVLVHQTEPSSGAWRIPFFIGALGCFVGLYLRLAIPETPAFMQVSKQHRLYHSPLLQLWRRHKFPMLQTAILAGFVSITFYLGNVYITTYLVQQQVPPQKAALITTLGQLAVALLCPLAGWLADRWGSKPVMLSGLCLIPIAGGMNYVLGQTGYLPLIGIAQLTYALGNALAIAPLFYWICRLYPPELRYSGTTFPWGMSAAIVGGTAPLIAQFSIGQGWYYLPVIYMTLITLLAMAIVGNYREDN